jgi:hypothetical protein
MKGGAMTATTERPDRTTSDTLRLELDPGPSRSAVLDGGWWPRSRDLVAELPGLVHELAATRGTITHAMMNADDWDGPHPRRLPDAGGHVRLGWYTSQPSGLLTLICEVGRDRFDLLVVPVPATAASAAAAMTAAADPGDTRSAPELAAGVERGA